MFETLFEYTAVLIASLYVIQWKFVIGAVHKWYPILGRGGTVPAIVFKMDILAQKVNFMNLKKQAIFIILDTPLEP